MGRDDRPARLAENLAAIRERIAASARRAGRDPAGVAILPATKRADAEAIRLLIAAGLTTFGENQVQAAEAKTAALGPAAAFVLIGHLQRNKVKRALAVFRAIHSVDSVELAEELARRLGDRTLPVLVEVNVGGEEQKHGFRADDALAKLAAIGRSGRLTVEGFMTVPPAVEDPEAARPYFRALRELRDEARRRGLGDGRLETLSMGMSGDYPVAVEEGATIVRIGSALFRGVVD